MALYNVDLDCPRCGHAHGVIGGLVGSLRIEHGPDRPGTIVELYRGRELPAVLVRQLNGKVWCEQANDYVVLGDPARVALRPHGRPSSEPISCL